MKILNSGIFVFVILFFGCNNKQDGFLVHKSGLQYKFIVDKENTQQVKQGDILILDLTYKTENDSLLFNTNELRDYFRIKLDFPNFQGGSVEDGLSLLSIGDSICFKVKAKDFYTYSLKKKLPEFINKSDYLTFNVKLLDIWTEQDVENERQRRINEMRQNEHLLIEEYVKDNKIEVKPDQNGMYFIVLKKGKGKKVKKGDKVSVHYVGKFITGEIFDSSVKRNQPFPFIIGNNNVIEGWEKAIVKMRQGDKVKLIIPSELAYGQNGFKSITPFSPLIFEIELLTVNSE